MVPDVQKYTFFNAEAYHNCLTQQFHYFCYNQKYEQFTHKISMVHIFSSVYLFNADLKAQRFIHVSKTGLICMCILQIEYASADDCLISSAVFGAGIQTSKKDILSIGLYCLPRLQEIVAPVATVNIMPLHVVLK